MSRAIPIAVTGEPNSGSGVPAAFRADLLATAARPERKVPARPITDPTEQFLEGSRARFLKSMKFPKAGMGLYNYPTWMRFLKLTGSLNEFEQKVVKTLESQANGPSLGQRQVLWRAMKRIFPEACTKWGQP